MHEFPKKRSVGCSIQVATTVKSHLIKKVLITGTAFSTCGIAIFAYCLLFLKPEILEKIGFAAYLTGGGLIAYGLIPFRTLSRLQLFPNTIAADDNAMTFFQNSCPVFRCPLANIQKLTYVAGSTDYGIGLRFYDMEQLTILDKRKFRSLWKARRVFDLFLPYFTKNSFWQLWERPLPA